ncbi:MAG: ABC transporter ATP-binding protein [Bacillales bacterium]|nr:ABC transporter ATP-binding protein [Bacillales bacterium]
MRMYTDLCTVKRYGEIETESGETRMDLTTVYEGVPCRISQKTLGSNNQSESTNRISYETKLFLSPVFEVRQGDVIDVYRTYHAQTYIAGEPFVYHRHQEVSLERKGNA